MPRPASNNCSAEWQDQCQHVRDLAFGVRTLGQLGGADYAFTRFTDKDEVRRFSERMFAGLRNRQRRGAKSFDAIFTGTLTGLDQSQRSLLTRNFSESPWFARYGELPDVEDQLSFEEACYRFFVDEGVGPPQLRFLEFVDAMICALVVQRRPAFAVPVEIERADFGWFVLAPLAERTLLVAAVRGSLVRGPVSQSMAAYIHRRGLRSKEPAVSEASWRQASQALGKLGIYF